MAELFPADLQDKFNEASFGYSIGDTSVTSQTQAGEPKKRQIYTKAIDGISGTIDLEIDDWTTLENFYKITLAGGVKTFNYDHPLTQVTSEYQFVSAPILNPLGGRYFRVSFRWRQVG